MTMQFLEVRAQLALYLLTDKSFSCVLATVPNTSQHVFDALHSTQRSPHVLGTQSHKQHRQALVGRINASAVSAQQQ